MSTKAILGLAGILLLLGLGGCDSAEKAADSFATKVEEAAREQARETLGGTLDELNRKVDEAQQQSRAWLDQHRPKQEKEEAAPPRANRSVEGVETRERDCPGGNPEITADPIVS